ncbi:MAG: endonuclease/exonuclease/phosphatase family protein [Planctomycetes bacterium]|nr:endonuclease/exonuclease/phosphatase family protein [Planctomycetota bacterium]
MKVMSYNTLFGGWDGGDDRRCRAQREVITSEKPDVLLLQECRHYDHNGHRRLCETEDALGMRGFLAVAPHTGQHTAVFARPELTPVAFEGDSARFHHAAATVTLRVPGLTRPVTFVSVHLCPNGSHIRLAEAAYLVAHAAADGFALVAGDFNSVSPLDPEPDWTPLSAHHRARYLSADGRADRRVLQTLYSAGYADLAHRLGRHGEPTVPGAGFANTEFVPFRSDYFLASASLAEKTVAYSVVRDERTDAASDHYPITAEFKL